MSIYIGIGGWVYESWRDNFYPAKLPQKRELEYAAGKLTAIEVNGTYYGSQKPESFRKWHDETPDGFVFTLKGPRFATNRLRVTNRDELVGMLAAIMRQGRRDDWIAKLEAVGVPCGPINNIAQAFAHPQTQARQLRRDLPHPGGGAAPVTASPLRFSDSPVVYRRAPPLLSQTIAELQRDRDALARRTASAGGNDAS